MHGDDCERTGLKQQWITKNTTFVSDIDFETFIVDICEIEKDKQNDSYFLFFFECNYAFF